MKKQEKLQTKEIVLFQGERTLTPGEVELHGFVSDLTGRLFGRSLDEVKEDWVKVSGQIKEMVESIVPESPEGFSLENVEVSLGFSATGELVFIAEAGVEASVSISFKRLPSDPSTLSFRK